MLTSNFLDLLSLAFPDFPQFWHLSLDLFEMEDLTNSNAIIGIALGVRVSKPLHHFKVETQQSDFKVETNNLTIMSVELAQPHPVDTFTICQLSQFSGKER